ncbi:MAG: hypothetical protein F6K32_26185 [Desertifilum sp. SIO1I2]|nr:hypothetical protein [Desertifilum sp. SIO1I2]
MRGIPSIVQIHSGERSESCKSLTRFIVESEWNRDRFDWATTADVTCTLGILKPPGQPSGNTKGIIQRSRRAEMSQKDRSGNRLLREYRNRINRQEELCHTAGEKS